MTGISTRNEESGKGEVRKCRKDIEGVTTKGGTEKKK
jgi:hypothetical protein